MTPTALWSPRDRCKYLRVARHLEGITGLRRLDQLIESHLVHERDSFFTVPEPRPDQTAPCTSKKKNCKKAMAQSGIQWLSGCATKTKRVSHERSAGEFSFLGASKERRTAPTRTGQELISFSRDASMQPERNAYLDDLTVAMRAPSESLSEEDGPLMRMWSESAATMQDSDDEPMMTTWSETALTLQDPDEDPLMSTWMAIRPKHTTETLPMASQAPTYSATINRQTPMPGIFTRLARELSLAAPTPSHVDPSQIMSLPGTQENSRGERQLSRAPREGSQVPTMSLTVTWPAPELQGMTVPNQPYGPMYDVYHEDVPRASRRDVSQPEERTIAKRPVQYRRQRTITRADGVPSNMLAEKLTADIFGERRWQENNTARERIISRRAARVRERPQHRNRDWMLHDGNVHYARNGGAFRVGGYTKLDLVTRMRLGLEEFGAIGIGTVDIVAHRALGSAGLCAITLHDVLHVPHAPCNGIAICRLEDSDVRISMAQDGCVASCSRTGEQLFAGTKIGKLFRVALFGESAARQKVLEQDMIFELANAASLLANPEDVSRFGRAARELQRVRLQLGVIGGERCGVSC